ncbi:MAG: type II toxin-antitoxin system RelE/ParE family toxin, partial [Candidatus Accumulibacter sp.]|nr:type II toxin-antitoxin system RelE/ParE family toxin [Accumulibacter sp.]
MHTIAETDTFIRYAKALWNDEERAAFVSWIAGDPLAGDVVPGSGGCRKVRWSRAGMGKRGGVRVIYFNRSDGQVWLLIAYAKDKFDNLPAGFLARLKEEVEHGQGNA